MTPQPPPPPLDKNKNDNNKKNDEEKLCQLLSNTIQSLSRDAYVLRRLASLHIALHPPDNQENKKNTTAAHLIKEEDAENVHPNHVHILSPTRQHHHQKQHNQSAFQQKQQQRQLRQTLQHIHHRTTDLEQKMDMLRHLMQEEIQSLHALEQVQRRAQDQSRYLSRLKRQLNVHGTALHRDNRGQEEVVSEVSHDSMAKDTRNTHVEKTHSTSSTNLPWEEMKATHQQHSGNGPHHHEQQSHEHGDASDGLSLHHPNHVKKSTLSKASSNHGKERSSVQTQQSQPLQRRAFPSNIQVQACKSIHKINSTPTSHALHLEPVTPEEFQSLPKSVRGRLSLVSVNAALEEIDRVCLKTRKRGGGMHSHGKKRGVLQAYKTPSPNQGSFTLYGRSGVSMSSGSFRGEGGQVHVHSASSAPDALSHHGLEEITVSEKVLRRSCAFFRGGESSARATLDILRRLKRLRQVCGGNNGDSGGSLVYGAKRSDFSYVCFLSPSSQAK